MTDTNNNRGGTAAPPAPEAGEAGGQPNILGSILNWLLIFFLVQNATELAKTKFMPPRDADTAASALSDPVGVSSDTGAAAAERQQRQQLKPKGVTSDRGGPVESQAQGWELTTPVGDDATGVVRTKRHNVLATWKQDGLIFGGKSDDANHKPSGSFVLSSLFGSDVNQDMNYRNDTLTIPFNEALWNNETQIWAHVKLQRRRSYKDGTDTRARNPRRKVPKNDVLVKRMALTRFRKRKRRQDLKSLIESPSREENETLSEDLDSSVLTTASLNKTHDQIMMYMKPSLSLQIVDMMLDFPDRKAIPKQFSDHMDWFEEGTVSDRSLYYPILYNSEFWITYQSLLETEENWRKQEAFTGEEDHGNDQLRNMLLDTNPWLLAVTAVVSVLHTVFDMLAFKNDISFFKNKKSMEGMSLRSMLMNSFFSLVILLYLADNETSFMVLASNAVGLVIEIWKISKAVTIKFDGGKIQWVEDPSYGKSKTKEYDEIATNHLMYLTMPLVSGYGLIDDLFAFVIKMPIMHRIACLRDDAIFFIYLYQRYKYKTDYTRVNEFGQCQQPTEEMVAAAASAEVPTNDPPTGAKRRRGAREKRD
ncbi:hypothetical protein THAOC_21871 [Thalassiosira oceanica]|uniref:Uncharacterized protein n=1 Tax=Thalassiosira oceanica TaxID=159749 RepID=K0SHN4_THAOC|nr:hypothetical protein THAOC_21871 [Thalassiosira oceanica]|eukprot:EJK58032.1 hypothetical protein THAOC_21871 [Thalassiosira oceanica]